MLLGVKYLDRPSTSSLGASCDAVSGSTGDGVRGVRGGDVSLVVGVAVELEVFLTRFLLCAFDFSALRAVCLVLTCLDGMIGDSNLLGVDLGSVIC